MTDREKLIALYNRLEDEGLACTAGKANMADLMIANGVTFAKNTNVPSWIPVSERLPNICEPVLICVDLMGGKAVRVSDRYGKSGMLWSGIPSNIKVTHWMPLPEPPKEVEQ